MPDEIAGSHWRPAMQIREYGKHLAAFTALPSSPTAKHPETVDSFSPYGYNTAHSEGKRLDEANDQR
jgi:hypothetical protein